MAEIKCSLCGSNEIGTRSNGTHFCKDCGADIIVATCYECGGNNIKKRYDGKYFCTDCGTIICSCPNCGSFDIKRGRDGLLFCRNCGTKTKENEDNNGANDTSEKGNMMKGVINGNTTNAGAKKKRILIPKEIIKPIMIIAAVTIIAVLLSLFLININCDLVNEWEFGVNKFNFKGDGTFSANVNTLSTEGTYTVEGEKIKLSYKFMGLMDKETELTYSISGANLSLTGDVTLTGSGSMTINYTCASGGSGGLIKLLIILIEVLLGGAVICFILDKTKKKKNKQTVAKY